MLTLPTLGSAEKRDDMTDTGTRPTLVLVTGAGRSGTSTIAGVLARLGYAVPEPVLAANASNPRGFYESWWPVRFHRRLMRRANIEQTDGRPGAVDSMREAVDDRARDELRDWLTSVLDGQRRVVVKDPRAVWIPTVWAEAARDVGADPALVTMLRHPSEVLGSRATYYAANRPSMSAREFAVMNLCGWINGNLTLERQTRDSRRAFVQYVELLADWRPVVTGLIEALGLPDGPLSPADVAAVDSFVEPDLRRHAVDWGDRELPGELVDIAEQVFTQLDVLAHRQGHDVDAERALDETAARYARLYSDAQAIAHDHATARAVEAEARGRREGRKMAQRELLTPAAPSPDPVRVEPGRLRWTLQALRRPRLAVRRVRRLVGRTVRRG